MLVLSLPETRPRWKPDAQGLRLALGSRGGGLLTVSRPWVTLGPLYSRNGPFRRATSIGTQGFGSQRDARGGDRATHGDGVCAKGLVPVCRPRSAAFVDASWLDRNYSPEAFQDFAPTVP